MKGSITLKNNIGKIIAVVTLLLLWKMAASVIEKDIILPPPEKVLSVLFNIASDDLFWSTIAATTLRGLKGFLLSFLAGSIAGMAAGFNKHIFNLFQPLVISIRSIPLMSIILLALIWFKTEIVAIFVCFLVIFPIIYSNVLEGVKNADRQLLEMAKLYRVKSWRLIMEVYVPGLLPYLLAGVSTALGMTWKVVVSAEVLSQPSLGIGTNLEQAKSYLETSQVLAWTTVAVSLSYLSETLLRKMEKNYMKWSGS